HRGIDQLAQDRLHKVHSSSLTVERRRRGNIGPLEVRPHLIKFRPMTGKGVLHAVRPLLHIVTHSHLGGHDIESEDFQIVTVQNYLTGQRNAPCRHIHKYVGKRSQHDHNYQYHCRIP
ncbi:MAG: hypothetical protein ACK55Z_17945, partial [bacterium]